MNWHEGCRSFQKEQKRISTKFRRKILTGFQHIRLLLLLLFGTSAVSTTSYGSNNLASLKVRQMWCEKQHIPPLSNDGFIIRFKNRYSSADVTNSKRAINCISPLESKNCKFEIKYIRIKAIIDVVSAQAGKFRPGTPIWLAQLKTNGKEGWPL